MAQDDYYYEIQLTNKQLVFYFMAGATGLILSFLAGVMVGRGVDQGGDVQAARPPGEARVAEEIPPPAPAQDLTYAQRLESDKPDERLQRPGTARALKPAAEAARSASPFPARGAAGTPASPVPRSTPAPLDATSSEGSGGFTIQVGAFKDGASAESIVSRLKERGFAAYVVPPASDGGLFNVRVGSYRERGEAEKVHARLLQEKFRPFIVKSGR